MISIPNTNHYCPQMSTEGTSFLHSTLRVKPHHVAHSEGGGDLQVTVFRLQIEANPFAERRQQIPRAVERTKLSSPQDSPMNKPVKHGLDLLSMKTTGLSII